MKTLAFLALCISLPLSITFGEEWKDNRDRHGEGKGHNEGNRDDAHGPGDFPGRREPGHLRGNEEFHGDGFQGGFQDGFEEHGQGGFSDAEDFQNRRHRNRGPPGGGQGPPAENSKDLTLVALLNIDTSNMPVSAKHGVPCKDPQKQEGICSYIADPLCAPFKTVLNDDRKQLFRRILRYIKQSTKTPCGYDGTDLTMCCPEQTTPTTTEQPPIPSTTSAATSTVSPTTTTPKPAVLPQECGQSKASEIELHIFGGTDASRASWPWAVVLGQPNGTSFKVVCGGTLITNQHVLTAAHCFQTNPTAATKITHVRLGEQDLSKVTAGITPVDVETCDVRKHEKFVLDTVEVNNDITVVKLCKAVEFGTYIQPVCLPTPDAAVPESLKIIGWGSDHIGGGAVGILKEADVVKVPLADCQQEYSVIGFHLDNTHICAGKGATDTCAGDSGGPILTQVNSKWTIVGITSFGVGCASDKFPGVYTNVAQFLDWIKEKLN